MIRIAFDRGAFSEAMNDCLGRVENPRRVLMAAGRELRNQLVEHFRGKDRTDANKLSDRREHFWLQVARSTNNPEQTGYNAVSVTVSDPRIAQKVFGGKIEAKEAGALTIPESEKAYGRRASTFEAETGLRLFLLKGKQGGETGRDGASRVTDET